MTTSEKRMLQERNSAGESSRETNREESRRIVCKRTHSALCYIRQINQGTREAATLSLVFLCTEISMEETEKIKVYVDVVNGRTVCICTRAHKGCNKACDKDVVERDRFRGWEKTARNRYGK